MPLQLRWVGDEDLDRVADTRLYCYAHAGKLTEEMRQRVRHNPTAKPGDFLLAEDNGNAVGTATSLSMTMWVRGAAIPCQGVAWVGTIKTHRRRTHGGDGIATQIMRETLNKAREREQVISALMPFRGSFYEHFGYGFVERRNEWTVPLSILPHGSFEEIRFYQSEDLPALVSFRQRIAESGQCDIERPANPWEFVLKMRLDSGFAVVDRPEPDGPIRGFLCLEHQQMGSKDFLRAVQINYADMPALLRQLHFLASLRDQYHSVILTLPIDLALNWLLRETQLPHRPVNHSHAELRQDTRMQIRILDHKRFLESIRLPGTFKGKLVIAVQESEGSESRFQIDFAEGRATATSSQATPDFICRDRIWAAIASGDLAPQRAIELGLAQSHEPSRIALLDAFAIGPAPFCHEYF